MSKEFTPEVIAQIEQVSKQVYNEALENIKTVNGFIVSRMEKQFEQCQNNEGRLVFASIIEAINNHTRELDKLKK